ncbi:hypothetical protein CHS0354_032526 [Potamilus streckersoni]|uniref:Phosphatidylinositol-glycan biosynthesis class F protein n=1 Tax=Potamilus streckersoni TaxID=2493646 RepID=A0AAE0SQ63_9BIVA|nr:hypothetical protein CHS0354_032526 [Potamilus streckersoni]
MTADKTPHSARKVLKRTLTWSLFCSLASLILLLIPFNSGTILDLVSNCLVATKMWISVILIQIFFICKSVTHSMPGKQQSKVGCLLKYVAVFLAIVTFFCVITILFGAPLTESRAETFHFAVLLSVAGTFPGLMTCGVNLDEWSRLYVLSSPEYGVEVVAYWTSLCSIFGAWLGAFPIPLDWDRPWQVWPISCVLGTLGGYIIGLILSSVHLFIKYYKMARQKHL